jgi:KUP system potassium uptake protein
MFIWFMMLAILGISHLVQAPAVLRALSPHYAINLLRSYPNGFWILGAVFLCTTGAEALYSDLGHCGKRNIRASWIFVKTALILNYLGQSAWLLSHAGKGIEGENPFYALMPEWFFIPGFIITTIATIVASQALISGSFTLINEAIRLNLWPKVRIAYPTVLKGQLYIPSINWLLFLGCAAVVLYLKESSAMEAAYGLTIIIGMMMSSTLLVFYMRMKRFANWIIGFFIVTYLTVESSFLVANMKKIPEGGYISLFIALFIALIMWIWYDARKIRNSYVEFVDLNEYLDLLCELKADLTVPKYATHLVYMTSANNPKEIEHKIIYSILSGKPKRADIFWFVHVDTLDEPYTSEYVVEHIIPNDIIRVEFRLGFRVAPRVNLMFKKVVEDLVANKEVNVTSNWCTCGRTCCFIGWRDHV